MASKRAADVQMTKDSTMGGGGGSGGGGGPWGAADAHRASASTLATRKMARPRGSRRGPGGTRPAFGLGATSASIRQQQSFPQFGQTEEPKANSFGAPSGNLTFDQNTSATPPNQSSQSFPTFQFTGSSANTNTSNPFATSGGSFDFNTTQTQNPFATSYNGAPPSASGVSHHGSIFNFESPAKTPKDLNNRKGKDINGNSMPLFAPGAPDIPPMGAQDFSTPAANSFTWPPAQQQPLTNASPFSMASNNQGVSQSGATDATTTPVNIFAGIKSPLAQDSQQNTAQEKPDILTQLTGVPPQPSENQVPFNPFAALKPAEEKKTDSSSNMFANIGQNSSNLFGTPPAAKPQAQFNPFSPEAMQTSPDNTPQKPQSQPPTGPITQANTSDKNTVAQPDQDSKTPAKFDLFSKISQADQTSKPASITSPDKSSQGTTSAFPTSGLFTGTAKPLSTSPFLFPQGSANSSTTQDMSTDSVSDTPPASSNLFAAFKSPHPAAENIFANKMAATSQSSTQSQESVQSVGHLDQAATNSGNMEHAHLSQGASNDRLPNNLTSSSTSSTGNAFLDFGHVPQLPPHLSQDDRVKAVVAWRLKQLDVSFQGYLSKVPDQRLIAALRLFYVDCREKIIDAGEKPVPNPRASKRSSSQLADGEVSDHNKRARVEPSTFAAPSVVSGSVQPVPTTTTPLSARNGAAQQFESAPSKRKAEEDPTRQDANEGSHETAKRARGQDLTAKSQTSNLFNSIIDVNERPSSSSSRGLQQITPTSASASHQDQTPARRNPFASILSGPPPNAASTQSTTASGSTQSVPKTDTTSAKLFNAPPQIAKPPSTEAGAIGQATVADSSESHASSASTTKESSVKAPSFNVTPSTNFMAQFGDAARKQAEAAKMKRKAEEYDSEEDDEAEWERKDAEAQAQKKQKIQEAAKSAQQFVPQFGASTVSKGSDKIDKPKSIFEQVHPAFGQSTMQNTSGLFSGLNNTASATARGEPTKASDQSTAANSQIPEQSASRSLFDRISKPDNKEASEDASADHTWKADSPIKFGATATSSAIPSVNITSESPLKTSTGNVLFGNAASNSDSPPKLGSNLFGNLTAPKSGGSAVGFAFAPAKGSTQAIPQPSLGNSRATSPGATTGDSAAESATENAEDSAPPQAQLDLVSQRVGEENEDVVFEIRAKALKFDFKEKQHVNKGVGPFRVLKHRETHKRRVVMRVDPGGSVVINSGILDGVKYEVAGKAALKATFVDLNGELSMWMVKVKTNELASELSEVLNDSKPNEA